MQEKINNGIMDKKEGRPQKCKGIKTESDKKRWVFIVLIALLVGGLVEIGYELNVCRKSMKGGHSLTTETLEDSTIAYSKGIQKKGLEYYANEESEIVITIPERYINKFIYHYRTSEDYQVNIKIDTKDIYKNPETRDIKEYNRYNLDTSVVNVRDYVTKIIITVPQGVTVSGFSIDNSWDFNWYRIMYAGTFCGLILAVILFRKSIARKVEYGFLIISIGCGLLFIAIQPLEGITWDEHIHFYKAFDWFESGTVDWSQTEWYLYTYQEREDRPAQLSKEEKALQAKYLNEQADHVVETYEKEPFKLNRIGYLHMALVIKIGEIIGLPFTALFILGKVTNLLLYSFILFWAIRVLPIGKKFLMTITLMPTPMLQSTTYTYDAVVIAFLSLGIALIVNEFYYRQRKLSIKKAVLILVVFLIGSCPKEVYIPLVLVFLALPNEKFKNEKVAAFCKGAAIAACIGLLGSMLLPAASGERQADARGGNTSVSQQLAIVMGHPFAYIRVLWNNITETFNNMFFGRNGLASLAYAGIHPFDTFVGILCIGVALTEKKQVWPGSQKSLMIFKGSLGCLLIGVVVLIWSALYIVFTEVGATEIAGVQGRYFIPLFLPIYLVFYSSKVEGRWKEVSYNTVLLLLILFLSHLSMYELFFQTFCV